MRQNRTAPGRVAKKGLKVAGPQAELKSSPTRILDAAERLWAEGSYEAVSIRDITAEAGVDLNLARYYFGSKEELYRHVVARRAEDLCRLFDEAFDSVLSEAKRGKPSLEAWIGALVVPSLKLLSGSDEGWRNYARFISGSASLEPNKAYLSPLYEYLYPVLDRFMDGIKTITGIDDENRVLWATYFLHAASISVFRSPHLMDRTSRGNVADEPYLGMQVLMPEYFAGAFRGFLNAAKSKKK